MKRSSRGNRFAHHVASAEHACAFLLIEDVTCTQQTITSPKQPLFDAQRETRHPRHPDTLKTGILTGTHDTYWARISA